MARMRVVQVAAPAAPSELVERERPSPGSGEARIRVEACGICRLPGITIDGGDADCMMAPAQALARIPQSEVYADR